MEQELWTLKGDDIEAYNNLFHELVLMCPELVSTEKKKIKNTFVGFLKKLKEISLLQSLQLCMMPSTWLVNWSSKQFKVGLLELVKAIKRNRKTTKETPTTITSTTTTTTTTTETTTITNNKTGGRKLPGPMLQPQLRVENPNVVTGTFLFNDHYACILFDSGAEKSFVSFTFTPFIDITPVALNTSYEVELADGKVVSTNTVLRGYTLDCYEKIVRIPLPNGEILKFQSERPKKDPGSLAYIKADEKKLDDILVVRDFPKVFLDDLSGLPPVREI
nr:hypothetical protein [Tanacetum cinerariifolium]